MDALVDLAGAIEQVVQQSLPQQAGSVQVIAVSAVTELADDGDPAAGTTRQVRRSLAWPDWQEPITVTDPAMIAGSGQVSLIRHHAIRQLLSPSEVTWAATPQGWRCTTALAALRPTADVTGAEISYDAVEVASSLRATHRETCELGAADGTAPPNVPLILAVIALEQQAVAAAAHDTAAGDGYSIVVDVTGLTVEAVETVAVETSSRVTVTLRAQLALRVSRDLRGDEGGVIDRILSPDVPTSFPGVHVVPLVSSLPPPVGDR